MIDAQWRAGGATVRGPRHVSAGKPNQDAVGTRDVAPYAIAVADGHGDPRCTRSDIGAAIAVQAALDVAVAFDDRTLEGEALRAALADAIVGLWSERARAHLEFRPAAAHEIVPLGVYPPLFAYGSTLVAAFTRGDAIIAVQIGDGDLLVKEDGVRRVFERDDRYGAHETTSLCQLDARAEVRVERFTLGASGVLIAATDGYANSFASDGDFTNASSEFHALLGTHGLAGLLARLPAMLEATTRDGSGDDISLAILARNVS